MEIKTFDDAEKALDALEVQVLTAFGSMANQSRELSIAVTKLEESMMWMRRALVKAKP